jgi:hypothetical protein
MYERTSTSFECSMHACAVHNVRNDAVPVVADSEITVPGTRYRCRLYKRLAVHPCTAAAKLRLIC